MNSHFLLPATLIVVFFVLLLRFYMTGKRIYSTSMFGCLLVAGLILFGSTKFGKLYFHALFYPVPNGWLHNKLLPVSDSLTGGGPVSWSQSYPKGIDTTEMPELSQYDKYDNMHFITEHSELQPFPDSWKLTMRALHTMLKTDSLDRVFLSNKALYFETHKEKYRLKANDAHDKYMISWKLLTEQRDSVHWMQ